MNRHQQLHHFSEKAYRATRISFCPKNFAAITQRYHLPWDKGSISLNKINVTNYCSVMEWTVIDNITFISTVLAALLHALKSINFTPSNLSPVTVKCDTSPSNKGFFVSGCLKTHPLIGKTQSNINFATTNAERHFDIVVIAHFLVNSNYKKLKNPWHGRLIPKCPH